MGSEMCIRDSLRGEPAARPKPAPAAANMSGNEAGFGSRVVVSEPPLADRAAGGGGASARKGETAKFRATVSSHKRAPPLIFILHEVSLDAGVHSRNVTSLAATAGFGPADVDAPSQLAGLPRASSSASRFDPRRGCADFGWEHRWPLNADEAQVALRSTFFRYKGAVPPAVRRMRPFAARGVDGRAAGHDDWWPGGWARWRCTSRAPHGARPAPFIDTSSSTRVDSQGLRAL